MPALFANLLLLFVALTWGLGFVAQQTAMEDIGPFQFVSLRFLLAALCVSPFAWLELKARRRPDSRPIFAPNHYRQMIVIGLIFFAAMSFQQIGLLATSVTNTGMLTGLYVLFVPLLVFLWTRQKQPIYIAPCALLAFAGIWLLGGGGLTGFSWGDGFVIICALFWALHVIVLGRYVQSMPYPVTYATVQFAVCGLSAGLGFFAARLLAWSAEPSFSLASLQPALPEILYAAIIAGGLSFTLQAIAQRYTSATVTAVLLSAESLFAAIGAAIIIGERLDWLGYLGCALLFAAISATAVLSSIGEEKGRQK